MKSFYIAGIKYQESQSYINLLRPTDLLLILPESTNPTANIALAVYYKSVKIGYVPKELVLEFYDLFSRSSCLNAKIIGFFPNRPLWKRFKIQPIMKALYN